MATAARASSSDDAWGAHAPQGAAAALVWLSRQTPLGRGGIRRKLFHAFEQRHSGPVDTDLWGARVRLHPGNNVSERKALMRPDHMDAAEYQRLADALARREAVFVDVGGNAGLYSLKAAMTGGRNVRVVMVEPNEALIGRFLHNLALAKADGLLADGAIVTTHAVAISDRIGEGVMTSSGSEGARSLVHGDDAAGQAVPLTTLHQLCLDNNLSHIDLLKIDVEGFEDEVLPPFFATAPSALWPASIILEHLRRSRWKEDCITMAEARGYRIALTTRNNTVLERVR